MLLDNLLANKLLLIHAFQMPEMTIQLSEFYLINSDTYLFKMLLKFFKEKFVNLVFGNQLIKVKHIAV